MSDTAIRAIRARQILDSRGRPTVEADVLLAGGGRGRAAVPSGASTGAAEAHELRDGDPAVFEGRGVRKAVAHVEGEIARALAGRDAADQRAIDRLLRELDGTDALARLGANAVLAVSLAACRAAADALGQALYARIAELAEIEAMSLPMPMVNILSGGLHAGRGMDVQDYLAVPIGAQSIEDAIHLASRVRNAAAALCVERGLPTLLADEGGLSPGFATSREALAFMVRSIERAGLAPGREVAIAVDVAATSLRAPGGAYRFAREGCERSAAEVIAMVESWVRDFPVVSIEDALDEEAWADWAMLTGRLGAGVQLVGDDLFVTHRSRLRRGIDSRVANAVLIKPNQNGTLSGTLDTMAEARRSGYATIVSARSGETEDAFIADIAVGTGAGQIKIGSLRGSERLCKYNQLLRIAGESPAPFAGAGHLATRP